MSSVSRKKYKKKRDRTAKNAKKKTTVCGKPVLSPPPARCLLVVARAQCLEQNRFAGGDGTRTSEMGGAQTQPGAARRADYVGLVTGRAAGRTYDAYVQATEGVVQANRLLAIAI